VTTACRNDDEKVDPSRIRTGVCGRRVEPELKNLYIYFVGIEAEGEGQEPKSHDLGEEPSAPETRMPQLI
jgi:hypothetical protein